MSRHGTKSGDDVGYVRIADQLDLILQPELAALQPGDLELVRTVLRRQRRDLLVEPPMFGLEAVQGPGTEWARIIVVHGWRL